MALVVVAVLKVGIITAVAVAVAIVAVAGHLLGSQLVGVAAEGPIIMDSISQTLPDLI